MTSQNNPPKADRPSLGFILRMVSNLLIIAFVLAGLLFVPAGRLDWIEGWVFLIGFIGFLVCYGVWAFRNDPAQLGSGARPGPT